MYQFSFNLNSLQQKFSLTSNYLRTNSVVVKIVDLSELALFALLEQMLPFPLKEFKSFQNLNYISLEVYAMLFKNRK